MSAQRKRRGSAEEEEEEHAGSPPPPPSGSFSIEHVPFCTQDVLQPGPFDPKVKRVGMLPQQKLLCCWTCGKAAAPLKCPYCKTGVYCNETCMIGDYGIHARYCKQDGKFYWPPAPRIVQQ